MFRLFALHILIAASFVSASSFATEHEEAIARAKANLVQEIRSSLGSAIEGAGDKFYRQVPDYSQQLNQFAQQQMYGFPQQQNPMLQPFQQPPQVRVIDVEKVRPVIDQFADQLRSMDSSQSVKDNLVKAYEPFGASSDTNRNNLTSSIQSKVNWNNNDDKLIPTADFKDSVGSATSELNAAYQAKLDEVEQRNQQAARDAMAMDQMNRARQAQNQQPPSSGGSPSKKDSNNELGKADKPEPFKLDNNFQKQMAEAMKPPKEESYDPGAYGITKDEAKRLAQDDSKPVNPVTMSNDNGRNLASNQPPAEKPQFKYELTGDKSKTNLMPNANSLAFNPNAGGGGGGPDLPVKGGASGLGGAGAAGADLYPNTGFVPDEKRQSYQTNRGGGFGEGGGGDGAESVGSSGGSGSDESSVSKGLYAGGQTIRPDYLPAVANKALGIMSVVGTQLKCRDPKAAAIVGVVELCKHVKNTLASR